jgi:prepilin-type N-terminal cleavage/methylation domain-containing protein
MKTPRATPSKSGFTVLELLVAMSITTIIVTVLVSVTSIAVDTWNRSRSELRASRQAKAMIETMARDFEALVYRRGNEFEWLNAKTEVPTNSTNAAQLIFLTAATDRYNGEIGTNNDKGGDVSCVGYLLDYKDPTDSGGSSQFNTFVLNRLLVNPDDTFKELLGQTDLETKFPKTQLEAPENFVCENIYQFTLSFHVEVTQTSGTTSTTLTEVVTLGQGSGSNTGSFKLKGTGIDTPYAGSGTVTTDQLKAGRLKAVEISLTVLSDAGVEQLRRRTFSGNQQAEFLAKNSYQYSKLVQVPAN